MTRLATLRLRASKILNWFATTFLRDTNVEVYRRDAQGMETGGLLIGRSDAPVTKASHRFK